MIDQSILENSLKAFHANDPEACEAECRKILDHQSDHPLGGHLLAWSLLETDRDYSDLLDQLVASPETANAKGIPAKATLGWLLWNAGRTRDAIRALTENINREPHRQDLQTLLGICLLMDDQFSPAAQLLKSVVSRSPRNPVPRFHLAHALLHLGDWEKGWEEFEACRFDLPVHKKGPYDIYTEQLWTGQDIAGKKIVIEGEQGFGDQIQFIRFAQHLKAELGAASVHYTCHSALVELMRKITSLDAVEAGMFTDYDYYVPVMSLPHRCGARIDSHLYTDPYIEADSNAIQKWRPSVPASSKHPVVGICWRSAPMETCSKGHGVNFVKHMKSFDHSDFENLLAKLKGKADIVCLQIDPSPVEIKRLRAVNAFRPRIENFIDTAAIISLCDCVVTIDTAVAHLAGALGAETHVLLSKGADWRWTHEGVWYPHTKNHRQSAEHCWAGPVDSAVAAVLN